MKSVPIWILVLIAVMIALLANSVSAVWAKSDERFSWWLIALVMISPLVFVSFGLTSSRLGVAVSSGVIDSLLTISTIAVGLILFQEWNRLSSFQYVGLLFALTGVFLMLYFPKSGI